MSRSDTGDELRDLAKAIEELLRNHPALSPAGAIVSNCCDHLRAIAQIHDMNVDTARAAKRTKETSWGGGNI